MFRLTQRTRVATLVLAAAMILGLFVVAAQDAGRWFAGRRGGLDLRRIALTEAPTAVKEAAGVLRSSRVAYVMPQGNTTYILVSTGEFGAPVEQVEAVRQSDRSPAIQISLRSSPAGNRLLVLAITAAVEDPRMVRVALDGHPMSMLTNPDHVPLTALPDHGSLVLVAPENHVRVAGAAVEISGFAKVYDGRVSVQVFADGNGRVLGEAQEIPVAAASPDWGSFRTHVAFSVPPDVTQGYVLVYDRKGGTKVAVTVRFGSK